MAFKDVNERSFMAATKIVIGESYTAYPVGTVEGKYGPCLILQNEDGSTTQMGLVADLKYALRDGKIVLGQLTRFTRLADEKIKGVSSPKAKFKIEQDSEQTVPVQQLAQVTDAPAQAEALYAGGFTAGPATTPVNAITQARNLAKSVKSN